MATTKFAVYAASKPFWVALRVEAESPEAAENRVREWLDAGGAAELGRLDALADYNADTHDYREIYRVREAPSAAAQCDIGPFGLIDSGSNG